MIKYNSKGNAMVYNALIIIMSVTFVAILGVLVLDIVNKTSLSPEFSCYDLKLSGHLDIQKACFNESSNNLEVSIRRDNSDSNFDSFDFSLLLDGKLSNWNCGPECSTCTIMDEGQLRKYLFDIYPNNFSDSGNNVISLKYYDCEMSSKQIIRC